MDGMSRKSKQFLIPATYDFFKNLTTMKESTKCMLFRSVMP